MFYHFADFISCLTSVCIRPYSVDYYFADFRSGLVIVSGHIL